MLEMPDNLQQPTLAAFPRTESLTMSCKVPLNNSSFQANCDSQAWGKVSSLEGNVKLAGDEAKDRMYEPKYKKKLVRVLTVVAYVFFVSLAAIMLSLYYMLIWNGHQKETIRVRMVNVPIAVRCSNDIDKGPTDTGQFEEIASYYDSEPTTGTTTPPDYYNTNQQLTSTSSTEEDTMSSLEFTNIEDYKRELLKFRKRSTLLKKINYRNILYNLY